MAKKSGLDKLDNTIYKISLSEVFYCQIPQTIIGNIWIAASYKGLLTIDFDVSEEKFLNSLKDKIETRFIKDDGILKKYQDQMQNYLDGDLKEFDIQIDYCLITPFQKEVLLATEAISYGQISSYGDISKSIGKPKASQAVGQALHNNPIPIVIPCHRVLGSSGDLGGYDGEMNSERKRKLLQLEGALMF